jgi:signal transduction histidine kinase
MGTLFLIKTRELVKEYKTTDLKKELEYSVGLINDTINERVNEIDFFSQLNLLKISLDFSRPEELSDFISSYIKKYSKYQNIIIYDEQGNYFASKYSVFETEKISKDEQKIPHAKLEIIRNQERTRALIDEIFNEPQVIITAKLIDTKFKGVVVAKLDSEILYRHVLEIKRRLSKFKVYNVALVPNIESTSSSQDLFYCKKLSDLVDTQSTSKQICVEYSNLSMGDDIKDVIILIVFSLMFIIVIYYFLYGKIVSKFLASFYLLIGKFDRIADGALENELLDLKIPELKTLNDATDKIILQLKEKQKLQKDKIRFETISKITSQVAHDIRSPLAALDMSIKSLENIAEEKRIIIRSAVNRIHDIANNLLDSEKTNKQDPKEIKSCLIPALIKTIVTEKRMQFRNLENVQIDFPLSSAIYGQYAQVNPYELTRILSNLINNAVEALPKQIGLIEINVRHNLNAVEISVKDNGKGIPVDILDKIFERGVSFEKPTGSGLGLAHAKELVESWGGTIRVESTLGVGSTFILSLPEGKEPITFVSKIPIKEFSEVVVLDDDLSIHKVWEGRLASISAFEKIIGLKSFTSPQTFKSWFVEQNKEIFRIFFIDYEFMREKENGLDVIQELGLKENTYLVTSRYEDPHVQALCEKLGIKLIDKGMAGFIPLEIV